jgi:hypothetical protein
MAKQTSCGSSVVKKFGHGMARVEDITWRSNGRGANASQRQRAGEIGGENRLGSDFDSSCKKREQMSKAAEHLAGRASATQHLVGREMATQHLAGRAMATQQLAGQATQLGGRGASEATQHLAGQAWMELTWPSFSS